MFTFFDKSTRFKPKYWSKRMSSSTIQEVIINSPNGPEITLIKALISNKEKVKTKEYIKNIIQGHKNALFILTTPSIRQTGPGYDYIYPGHNASFITDENGIICNDMSKRPSNQYLCSMKPVPDSRFTDISTEVRLYEPIFTSIAQEITVWESKALLCNEYPIYIHILPFSDALSIDRADYERNVGTIKEEKTAYVLRSYVNPFTQQYIAAKNCNHAVEQSLFGRDYETVHDLFTQKAIIHLVERFIQDNSAYRHAAICLGLYDGIENSAICKTEYEPISMVI